MLRDKARNHGKHASAVGRQPGRTSIWRSPGIRIFLWLVIALELAAILHISSNY
ncbi:hypothetical protein [Novosphingobium album (ex Liu et al. 2023)]|uniref:Uncharacterized protein n=1 Tax=Novosphingobium album (ex Liu et al. 2023) TaxID=3031130 RepID=A0ABT5WN50_9SPHN|nr:hypothetical protein [Novosphingobium album (ex Liu et al. 2023)]MDE8651472.1 hypothetical protein [Novosphingobium album (ex Liu et al. 2023)]